MHLTKRFSASAQFLNVLYSNKILCSKCPRNLRNICYFIKLKHMKGKQNSVLDKNKALKRLSEKMAFNRPFFQCFIICLLLLISCKPRVRTGSTAMTFTVSDIHSKLVITHSHTRSHTEWI